MSSSPPPPGAFADASVLAADPDFKALVDHAQRAVHLAMDKAAAHVLAPGTYPLPSETRSVERVFHERLQTLPAADRNRYAAEAKARLESPTPERRQRYGAFGEIPVTDATSVIAKALAAPVPTALRPAARRLRERDAWPELTELLDRRPTAQRRSRQARKSDVPQAAQAGADLPPIDPFPERLIPTRARLRVHRVLCNDTTDELTADEIQIAGAGNDIFTRTEYVSEITKVGKFRKKEDDKIYRPPLVVADLPVLGGALFDVVQSGTIFLAERDPAGGFRRYVDHVRSLSATEFREAVVVAVAALVIVAVAVYVGAAGAVVGAAAGAPSGPAGAIVAAVALGAFGAIAGAVVSAVAMLTILPTIDALARWLRSDMFPPIQVTNHVRLLAEPNETQTTIAPPTSFRGGTYTVTYDWLIDYTVTDDPLPEAPRSPTEASPTSAKALSNLKRIDHIVVLMLENRSFDHMLGYLSLEGDRPEVEGLTPELFNRLHDCDEQVVQEMRAIALSDTAFLDDPGHNIEQVKRQLWGALADLPAGTTLPDVPEPDMSGFVDDFKIRLNGIDNQGLDPEHLIKPCEPFPPHDTETSRRDRIHQIMGYHTADQVPTFDLLAAVFGICDQWYSSYPGNTWVNRTIATVGRPGRRRHTDQLITNNTMPFDEKAFVRILDAHDPPVTWAWYSQDLPSLAAVDGAYAARNPLRLRSIQRFLKDAADDDLPSVAWIDPNFVDVGPLAQDLELLWDRLGWRDDGSSPVFTDTANDDHPPTDVTNGQAMVFQVFWTLFNSPAWDKTLLVITYDEHGGFYDHEIPPPTPAGAAESDAFKWLGARVPTIIVSPLVGHGLVSHTPFDHASIIKTIFTRFDISVPASLPRVAAANHLGGLLDEPNVRFSHRQPLSARPAVPGSRPRSAAAPRFAAVGDRVGRRLAALPQPKRRPLTELQQQVLDGRRHFGELLRSRSR